jgi:hypothetical protein
VHGLGLIDEDQLAIIMTKLGRIINIEGEEWTKRFSLRQLVYQKNNILLKWIFTEYYALIW